jgi:aldose 1-epimerase
MIIKQFGNSKAHLYTLKNKNGMELILTDIGASIVSILIPVCGKKVDVVLGYNFSKSYEKNPTYLGAVIGRYAGRIAKGKFLLDGKIFTLCKNDGENSLHSGPNCFAFRFWNIKNCSQEEQKITFVLESPDGDQSMPGNLKAEVSYTLTNDNEIVIDYYAVSDKKTPMNFTNHCYFNLNGQNNGTILNNLLWLAPDKIAVSDKDSILTGEIKNIKNTPLDFTKEKSIGLDIDKKDESLILAKGYDHSFVIDNPNINKCFAKAYSPKTSIEAQFFTDRPCVQFYSGNHLSENAIKDEKGFVKHGGFCLETQNFPNGPNLPNFPKSVYDAGETFCSKTIFRFAVVTAREQ